MFSRITNPLQDLEVSMTWSLLNGHTTLPCCFVFWKNTFRTLLSSRQTKQYHTNLRLIIDASQVWLKVNNLSCQDIWSNTDAISKEKLRHWKILESQMRTCSSYLGADTFKCTLPSPKWPYATTTAAFPGTYVYTSQLIKVSQMPLLK